MKVWNKGLKNEPKCLAIGKKMAETRRRNGWFRDPAEFSRKRKEATTGQKNPIIVIDIFTGPLQSYIISM